MQNIENGNIWCDRNIIGTISMMFNVAITIVSPSYASPWRVFHNTSHPGIVLVINAGDIDSTYPMTHISSTGMSSNN